MISGQGLHGGRPSSVVLVRGEGETTLVQRGVEVRVSELRIAASARSTTVASADGRVRVATVEHLFAALAAYGARWGVRVTIEGDEVPLADGGARAFCDAVLALGVAEVAPALRVARAGTVELGGSAYRFFPAERPSVEVEVDFDEDTQGLARAARWDGDAEDFRARIAPARTFGFERELGRLLEQGLASHVTPESVVVLTARGALSAGRPFEPDEPARHKLLDLIGDLFAHGGPPLGRVVARRPGHAATHEAVRLATSRGLLSRAV